MNNILLSIIIPAYNSGKFLTNTLDMLVAQDLTNCEVILVNDGSTDDTEDICKLFVQKYENRHYFYQENQGVSVARNVGISKAKGSYIYFFDSDDGLPDGTLDYFRMVLSQNILPDICVFGYEVRRNATVSRQVFANRLHNKYMDSFVMKKKFLEKKLSFHICSSLYRRAFLLKHNIVFPCGVKIGEDIVFMINTITKANSLYYSKRLCFFYQIRNDSVMQGYKGYNLDRMRSFEVVRDSILNNAEHYVAMQKAANFFIANFYLANLVAYFKSGTKNYTINTVFLENKFFLYKHLHGRFINNIAIWIARCLPLRFLFKLLK